MIFRARVACDFARIAQLVERFHGKEEVQQFDPACGLLKIGLFAGFYAGFEIFKKGIFCEKVVIDSG